MKPHAHLSPRSLLATRNRPRSGVVSTPAFPSSGSISAPPTSRRVARRPGRGSQDLAEAAKWYRRAAEVVPLRKRNAYIRDALGPDHTDLATDLNNLAIMYHAQRRYTDAEPLFKRSLAIRDKAFGPDHLSAAASLEDYAALMSDTGRPAEASEMEARAKAIWTKLAEGGLPATVAAPYVKAGIQETHKSAAAAPRV